MNMPILTQMEEKIGRLSLDEQRWLMERLAQRIKQNSGERANIEEALVAMANDPDIQSELEQIEKEFAVAEADGLDIG